MLLFRPVGLRELELVAAADWRAWPPRLPGQPIFYPVLNRPYAEQIARDWNTVDEASGFAGFVTEFELPDDYAARFERRVVGAALHEELWVPAEELAELNAHLVGPIRALEAFYGERFAGTVDPGSNLPTSVVGDA